MRFQLAVAFQISCCNVLILDLSFAHFGFCGIYLDEIVLTVFLSAVHFREELQHLFMAALAEGKFQKGLGTRCLQHMVGRS